jgi:hypothetical protein
LSEGRSPASERSGAVAACIEGDSRCWGRRDGGTCVI